jgi:hypothetical protein
MTSKRQNTIRLMLRELPIDQRAQVIVEIFQIITAEFAAMVLEHVKPRATGNPTKRMRNAALAGWDTRRKKQRRKLPRPRLP